MQFSPSLSCWGNTPASGARSFISTLRPPMLTKPSGPGPSHHISCLLAKRPMGREEGGLNCKQMQQPRRKVLGFQSLHVVPHPALIQEKILVAVWCFRGPLESRNIQPPGQPVFTAVDLLTPWTGPTQVIWAEASLSQQVVFCSRKNERLPP